MALISCPCSLTGIRSARCRGSRGMLTMPSATHELGRLLHVMYVYQCIEHAVQGARAHTARAER
eukprot:3721960-Alexandrium_andersonii.AAC.1